VEVLLCHHSALKATAYKCQCVVCAVLEAHAHCHLAWFTQWLCCVTGMQRQLTVVHTRALSCSTRALRGPRRMTEVGTGAVLAVFTAALLHNEAFLCCGRVLWAFV